MDRQVQIMLQNYIYEHKRQKRIAVCLVALSFILAVCVPYLLIRPVVGMSGDPICGLDEHIHSELCYTNTLICTSEHGEEHSHGEDCYCMELICPLAEHTHIDTCYPYSPPLENDISTPNVSPESTEQATGNDVAESEQEVEPAEETDINPSEPEPTEDKPIPDSEAVPPESESETKPDPEQKKDVTDKEASDDKSEDIPPVPTELILCLKACEGWAIEKPEDESFSLYKHLSADGSEFKYSELLVSDSIATMDISFDGKEDVSIELLGGSYKLSRPGEAELTFSFMPDENGVFRLKDLCTYDISGSSSLSAEIYKDNCLILDKVTNESLSPTDTDDGTVPLTVRMDFPSGVCEPMLLQLYCNGVSMGEEFQLYFDGVPWEGVWTQSLEGSLPIYLDGEAAEYSLRVETLGAETYSDAYASMGGYANYYLQHSPLAYEGEGNSEDIGKSSAMSLALTVYYTVGDIVLHVMDDAQGPIAGASFLLYEGLDGAGTVSRDGSGLCINGSPANNIGSASSSADGIVYFGGLSAGFFYLTQSVAPEGYVMSEDIYRVFIDAEGQMKLAVLDTQSNSFSPLPTAEIINPQVCATLSVRLMSSAFEPVGGAVMSLFMADCSGEYQPCPEHESIVIEESGTPITGLVSGDYRLEEAVTPEGFYPSKPVSFSVDKLGEVSLSTTEARAAMHEPDVLTIFNHAGVEMPETGGIGTAPFYAAGSGLMLIALLLLMKLKNGRADI